MSPERLKPHTACEPLVLARQLRASPTGARFCSPQHQGLTLVLSLLLGLMLSAPAQAFAPPRSSALPVVLTTQGGLGLHTQGSSPWGGSSGGYGGGLTLQPPGLVAWAQSRESARIRQGLLLGSGTGGALFGGAFLSYRIHQSSGLRVRARLEAGLPWLALRLPCVVDLGSGFGLTVMPGIDVLTGRQSLTLPLGGLYAHPGRVRFSAEAGYAIEESLLWLRLSLPLGSAV